MKIYRVYIESGHYGIGGTYVEITDIPAKNEEQARDELSNLGDILAVKELGDYKILMDLEVSALTSKEKNAHSFIIEQMKCYKKFNMLG